MAQTTVSSLIANLEEVLAQLKQMPGNLEVSDFTHDDGGYCDPIHLESFSIHVDEVKEPEDGLHFVSLVTKARQHKD